MANRLATATSPYLLAHKDNPVDWWPWCPEAFEEARRRDVPVFLSVGYSSCHWCHVMAHESFEDPETARFLNEHFVSVKVDREERPDVDAVYMEAAQAMTGRGGWPLSCFLTPDGEPFFAGTYFPDRPRGGMPSFRQVLEAVWTAWRSRGSELAEAGRRVVAALEEHSRLPTDVPAPTLDLLDAAVAEVRRHYDPEHGGFGPAPKFPQPGVLEFLIRHGSLGALEMVGATCAAMARGGIYDQLAGGFHRYSVDATWTVPHFEKMLYDNANLLAVYVHWWRAAGAPIGLRIAQETAEFLLREMRTPAGAFASALDADAAGVEGETYLWRPDEFDVALPGGEADRARRLFGVTGSPHTEDGRWVLRLAEDPADSDFWRDTRRRLLEYRRRRPQPERDDKVVSSWNGLAIGALAEAGIVLQRSDFVDAALAAAEYLLAVHLRDGRLRRSSRDGVVSPHDGSLDDYANVAQGLLVCAQVTSSARYLEEAGRLLDVVLTHFRADDGGFHDTADDAERLVRRPRALADEASASGNSAAAHALLSYAALTGSQRHRDAVLPALRPAVLLARRHPLAVGYGLAALAALLDGPAEIAVVGNGELWRTAWSVEVPGAVRAAMPLGGEPWAPLLEGRSGIDGGPAAYVCRGFVCQRPVATPEELKALLDR
ncbi:MAG: thioredoxin domain-containing protein [Acidothermus sp.]|nr:thioredoxin domain-containing protein [Acidothermus sp.]MCL6537898.1 thioredoxin domain-containing protein [Acidothermus sp.]